MSFQFTPASPEELAERGITPEQPQNTAPAPVSAAKPSSEGETPAVKAPARKTAKKAT